MANDSQGRSKAKLVTVQCTCGKRVSIFPQNVGKRLKCPQCYQIIEAPKTAGEKQRLLSKCDSDKSVAISKWALVSLWGFVGAFAVTCVVFVLLHSRESERGRVADANKRIAQAMENAQNWTSAGVSADGEAIEVELKKALTNPAATEKGGGIVVLEAVKQRRVRLEGENTATEKFVRAKQLISQKEVLAALPLLKAYVADMHATDRTAATRLITEAESATSEAQIFDAVVSMSAEAFDRVRRTGELADGKIQTPVLQEVQRDTLARVFDKATARRIEISLADAERHEVARREEEERIRRAEVDRAANEKLEKEKREQLEAALEDTTDALKRNRELAQRKLLAPVIGHWHANDGRELFVDAGSLIVVDRDGTAGAPVAHGSARHVVLPPHNDASRLTVEQNRQLGKLLRQLADVSLLAFGLNDHDTPGADFYIFEGEKKQVLDMTMQVTNIVAIRKDIGAVGAEWVQLATVDERTVSGVYLIKYVGKEVTPR